MYPKFLGINLVVVVRHSADALKDAASSILAHVLLK